MKRLLASIIAIGLVSTASAEDLGPDLLLGLGMSAFNKGEEMLEGAPKQLESFLDGAAAGTEFTSEAECLGKLQLAVNAASLVANLLPFSQVQTSKGAQEPSAAIRLLINGEKIHVQMYCDGTTLRSVPLPWGEGTQGLEIYERSTVDAVLGSLLLLQTDGAFDEGSSLDLTGQLANPKDGDGSLSQCNATAGVAGDLGGPFTLVNSDGEIVTDTDVITEPTLIYFGYTYCPDVCPLDVERNAVAVEILEERGQSVTPVFITIDPERDTPEVVRDFAEAMHPRMIGLTGTAEQIAEASKAYRTYYKANRPVFGEYLVDHSTFSYLVTPEQGFVEFFRRELSAADMAEAIACFIDQAN